MGRQLPTLQRHVLKKFHILKLIKGKDKTAPVCKNRAVEKYGALAGELHALTSALRQKWEVIVLRPFHPRRKSLWHPTIRTSGAPHSQLLQAFSSKFILRSFSLYGAASWDHRQCDWQTDWVESGRNQTLRNGRPTPGEENHGNHPLPFTSKCSPGQDSNRAASLHTSPQFNRYTI